MAKIKLVVRATIEETFSDFIISRKAKGLAALLKKPDIRKATFAEYRDWVMINFLLNCGSQVIDLRKQC